MGWLSPVIHALGQAQEVTEAVRESGPDTCGLLDRIGELCRVCCGEADDVRIVDQLPRKVAMELLLTGEPISAEEAQRWGLINQVVPDGESVLEAAVALAERITLNAPLAVQASKRVAAGVDDGAITAEKNSWKRSNREMRVVFTSEDAMEGPMAFAQKRAPVWKAR